MLNNMREVRPGVILTRSTLGGFSIEVDGKYVGWIHASVGDQWNAYLRTGEPLGTPLGRFPQEQAVLAIVAAARREPLRFDNPNTSNPGHF